MDTSTSTVDAAEGERVRDAIDGAHMDAWCLQRSIRGMGGEMGTVHIGYAPVMAGLPPLPRPGSAGRTFQNTGEQDTGGKAAQPLGKEGQVQRPMEITRQLHHWHRNILVPTQRSVIEIN